MCNISQSKSDNKNLLLNYQENTDILSFDYYNGSTWKGRTKLLTNSDLSSLPIKLITSLPDETGDNISYFFKVPVNTSIEGPNNINLPAWTFGLFIGNTKDGALIAIDTQSNLYIGYRNTLIWNSMRKL